MAPSFYVVSYHGYFSDTKGPRVHPQLSVDIFGVSVVAVAAVLSSLCKKDKTVAVAHSEPLLAASCGSFFICDIPARSRHKCVSTTTMSLNYVLYFVVVSQPQTLRRRRRFYAVATAVNKNIATSTF